MKNKSIAFTIALIFFTVSKAHSQDVLFTQWENIPLLYNPALTGNFEGMIRCRGAYRNQWASVLKENAYQTSTASAEYKLAANNYREINMGAMAMLDKAGDLDFRNKSFTISTSVIQPLGHPDSWHHLLAAGFNLGWTFSQIDLENAQWPGGMPPQDVNEKTSYPDVSAGLLWQYASNSKFSFNLGAAMHHLNRPNVSFSDSSVYKLNNRFNLHGRIEIPLVQKISLIPSFLFSSQGPSEKLLWGFHSRWYPKSNNPNYMQIGFWAKTAKNQYGKGKPIYAATATVELNSLLIGFSFEHFQAIKSNAYEFFIGYTFKANDTKVSKQNN